jgi:hypothetical protein
MISPPVGRATATPALWWVGLGLALVSLALALVALITSPVSLLLILTLVLAAVMVLLWVWRLLTPAALSTAPSIPAPLSARPALRQQGPAPVPPGASPPARAASPAPAPLIVGPPPASAVTPDARWLERDPFYSALDEPDASVRAFIAPKHEAESMVECEDSYALDPATRRYAVADGVSGSELPRPWARLLARTFVQHPNYFTDAAALAALLPRLGEQWRAWVTETWFPALNGGRAPGDSDAEFQRRVKTGAQATLLGCALAEATQRPHHYTAHVVAVGDADFFQFRRAGAGWQHVATYPIADPHDFGRYPHTLLTNPDFAEKAVEWRRIGDFPVETGDLLALATDSLAKWLLEQVRAGADQWRKLLDCRSADEFAALIAAARKGADGHTALEDDDVTLLLVTVPPFRAAKEARR